MYPRLHQAAADGRLARRGQLRPGGGPLGAARGRPARRAAHARAPKR